MKFLYDKSADVLYAFVGDPRPGVFEESSDGIYIRLDPESGQPTGFTIINYSLQKKDGRVKNIPNFPDVQIPY